ncbi:hypothetical protein J8J14_06910 [Roseomonas sp. SSH11]|uniref:Uncharacterized protein n=1 Tax=Pararoseomonas baculiformis TaxID=2820812 RepID=A0ABS4ABX3_9PROT|nr:hypothetical protein [Pararoseomonas baculiformis]MBP0444508.1 hypothetical protein [Pararoseomonas baculiformis]
MSIEPVQGAAMRPARRVKAIAKTADFKGTLARAQAPFQPHPAPARNSGVAEARPAARGGESGFRGRIAAQESAGAGWAARNLSSGALGRYQMLPVALRDIGWQDAEGGWTAQAAASGVRSESDFLASPAAQEAAMTRYLQRTEQQLSANGALGAAGRTVTAMDGQPLPITQAGLVAAAHRRGAGTVARWLDHRTRTPDAPVPETSRAAFASVEQRLRDFAGLSYAVRGGVSPSA